MPKPSIMKAALFLAVCTLAPQAHADRLELFGPAVTVGVVQGLTLSPAQKEGLRHFKRQKSYFGAMYVSQDGKSYQHYFNWHSLKRVKQATRQSCEQLSQDTCVLAAVSVPKGLDPNMPDLTGFGSSAAREMIDYRTQQVAGTYGAFAVSGSAHEGYSYGWDSEAEARATAIAYCQIGVVKDLAPLGIEGRKFAVKQGYNICRVTHITTPAKP